MWLRYGLDAESPPYERKQLRLDDDEVIASPLAPSP
jgi:hypothetical protein